MYALLLVTVSVLGASDADPPSQKSELAALLARIRENEALYDHLEVRYTLEMEGLPLPGETASRNRIRFLREETWAVWQSPYYYGRVKYDRQMWDGTRRISEGQYGYDGEFCRRNFLGGAANIIDEKVPEGELRPPHRWAVSSLYDCPTLADYLEGGPCAFSKPIRGRRLETSILGHEEIGGVDCIKLLSRYFRADGSEGNSRTVTWVAPARNYLAVRHELYMTYADRFPVSESQVSQWREIAPGVWLPFRCEGKSYDISSLMEGKRVLRTHATLTLQFARLDPDYGIELFRNVKMPERGPVYTIKGGQIVKSEWRGPEPREALEQSRSTVWLWFAAANALFVVIGLALLWWRRCRVRARIEGMSGRGE